MNTRTDTVLWYCTKSQENCSRNQQERPSQVWLACSSINLPFPEKWHQTGLLSDPNLRQFAQICGLDYAFAYAYLFIKHHYKKWGSSFLIIIPETCKDMPTILKKVLLVTLVMQLPQPCYLFQPWNVLSLNRTWVVQNHSLPYNLRDALLYKCPFQKNHNTNSITRQWTSPIKQNNDEFNFEVCS